MDFFDLDMSALQAFNDMDFLSFQESKVLIEEDQPLPKLILPFFKEEFVPTGKYPFLEEIVKNSKNENKVDDVKNIQTAVHYKDQGQLMNVLNSIKYGYNQEVKNPNKEKPSGIIYSKSKGNFIETDEGRSLFKKNKVKLSDAKIEINSNKVYVKEPLFPRRYPLRFDRSKIFKSLKGKETHEKLSNIVQKDNLIRENLEKEIQFCLEERRIKDEIYKNKIKIKKEKYLLELGRRRKKFFDSKIISEPSLSNKVEYLAYRCGINRATTMNLSGEIFERVIDQTVKQILDHSYEGFSLKGIKNDLILKDFLLKLKDEFDHDYVFSMYFN